MRLRPMHHVSVWIISTTPLIVLSFFLMLTHNRYRYISVLHKLHIFPTRLLIRAHIVVSLASVIFLISESCCLLYKTPVVRPIVNGRIS